VVEEAFKYAAEPEDPTTSESAWNAIQTCREVYNHALTQEYKPAPDYDKPSYTAMQNKLPEWKREWPEWSSVYSKCLQMAVRRIKHSETILGKLKERGFDVGELKWKAPRDYRSITYNQSGFDVDNNTGPTDHATVVHASGHWCPFEPLPLVPVPSGSSEGECDLTQFGYRQFVAREVGRGAGQFADRDRAVVVGVVRRGRAVKGTPRRFR